MGRGGCRTFLEIAGFRTCLTHRLHSREPLRRTANSRPWQRLLVVPGAKDRPPGPCSVPGSAQSPTDSGAVLLDRVGDVGLMDAVQVVDAPFQLVQSLLSRTPIPRRLFLGVVLCATADVIVSRHRTRSGLRRRGFGGPLPTRRVRPHPAWNNPDRVVGTAGAEPAARDAFAWRRRCRPPPRLGSEQPAQQASEPGEQSLEQSEHTDQETADRAAKTSQ
jgi:hypothetical protein